MSYLLILESPAKANTIKGYLGSKYKVVASKGHIRDLPKSTFGIDIDNNFDPHYINIRGKGDLIKQLKNEVKKADKVFLATDPDREGEAISWHLANSLGIPVEKAQRITFNEITKTAVKEAIKQPRKIDMNLVDAQQARRILDRIVGYKASPFLWKKVRSGLSAGRVQSAATKIIVDREEEIESFIPEEYWTIDAILLTEDGVEVTAKFYGKINDKNKMNLSNVEESNNIIDAVKGKRFTAASVKNGVRTKNPMPPFITSTLQQEASKKLNFQSQRTMRVAQELYEGINLGSDGGTQGLITYMRTDSLRIATEAQEAARKYIEEKYGTKYVPVKNRIYKSKATAQDAHEAIRPSSMALEPQKIKKHLSSDQYRLYSLIWNRFVASQMESAELSTTSIDFECNGYVFKTSGYSIKFNGYLKVYDDSESNDDENVKLPLIKNNDILDSKDINGNQHFTEPPSRYTEASLIKFFEEKGIGRPSTYTPIITTIISRGYISREGKSLVPTQLGRVTTKLMTEYFPDIVDSKFTADMETKLDEVENGNEELNTVLANFYDGFKVELDKAMESAEKESINIIEETDIICDKCGSKMIIKNGRFGKFAACPNYPTCKSTKPLTPDKPKVENPVTPTIADFKCELCGSDVVIRSGKYGAFYACSQYPKCKFTKQKLNKLGVKCPECGSEIVTKFGRNGKIFYSCEKYPDCQFSSWDIPTNEKCPDCGKILFIKKQKNLLVCESDFCNYKRENDIEIK